MKGILLLQPVPQPDGRLVVVYRYKDGSGRNDAGHAEFLDRQEAKQETAETAAARAVNRTTGKSEVRSETSSTLLFSAPDHARLETERSTRIEDGTVEWEVFPRSNEYVRMPQAKDQGPRLLSYGLLDGARGEAKIPAHQSWKAPVARWCRPTRGAAYIGSCGSTMRPTWCARTCSTNRALADPNDAVAGRYYVNGWPTTVLIDREGKVAYYSEGMEPEKLRDALLRLGIW
jgi:hypothetical protein